VIDLVRGGAELLLVPLDRMPEGVALAVVSILSGVIALYVVKWTTDQRALQAARDQLAASLLEVRLFLDSPRRVFRAQLRVTAWTGRYMARAMPALLLMVVPFTLAFMHLFVRHEVAPLPIGEDVLVQVELDAGSTAEVTLTTPAGVVQTAPLFVAAGPIVYARVRASEAGRHELAFTVGGEPMTKLLVAGEGRVTSPERRSGLAGLWALGTEGATSAPVSRVFIEHPPALREWLGMPWWLFWLVVSTVAALVLRKPLGVVI
jgi:hypothetical protein